MTFSFVIINYRQKQLTLNCVRSITEIMPADIYEVILVNNSPEDDLSELKSVPAKLKIIQNENKGFSQANNLAAKEALGDYIIFLNADTELLEDFSRLFIESFSGKEFGAVGLKLVNPDGSFQLSFWKENTFLNEIRNKSAENRFKNKNADYVSAVEDSHSGICKVDWVSGAAMVVRKSAFQSAGGFDENFFLFYEDADLCKRFDSIGLGIYYFPHSKILHFKGENVNKAFDSDTYYHAKASQLKYYSKHNGLMQTIVLRVYIAVRFMFRYLTTGKELNKRILKLSLGMK